LAGGSGVKREYAPQQEDSPDWGRCICALGQRQREALFARLLFSSRQFAKRLFWLSKSAGQGNLACEPTMPSPSSDPAALQHLPPHLREVCDLLARGLLRLRSRAAEEAGRDAAATGDIRLHSTARQRRHANPENEGVA
jgi:hypothetical protein